MATAASVVEGIIVRTMREQGFIGSIEVSNVRKNKTGYSAAVAAKVGTVTVPYRGRIAGTTVKITKAVATAPKAKVAKPDAHGNVVAVEGCTRCVCGAKYWENDVCHSCGGSVHAAGVER